MPRSDDLIQLLSGATTSAAPSVSSTTVGKARSVSYADEALAIVQSTAGSGAMTAIVKLWGWNEARAQWIYIGAMNGGTAIPLTGTAYISYCELVVGIGKFDKFYAELGALGGTATAVSVYLDFVRPGAHA